MKDIPFRTTLAGSCHRLSAGPPNLAGCTVWTMLRVNCHHHHRHNHKRNGGRLGKNGGLEKKEEGLEALNKMIRSRHDHGARKDSMENNFRDWYNHLWDRSRPTIVAMEREIKSKKPKILIVTEIEVLVETIFLEEWAYFICSWRSLCCQNKQLCFWCWDLGPGALRSFSPR